MISLEIRMILFYYKTRYFSINNKSKLFHYLMQSNGTSGCSKLPPPLTKPFCQYNATIFVVLLLYTRHPQ